MIAVANGKATVELEQSPACNACGLCSAMSSGNRRLVLDAVEGLEPGRTVIVAVSTDDSLLSVSLLFGLPLIALVAGVIVGYAWPVPGLTPDGSAILVSAVLVAAAFLAAVIYDRKVAAGKMPRPAILRIEPE